jgi:triphosphatase
MSTERREIELKFRLTEAACEALRQELFPDVQPESLVSIYYDTPRRELRQAQATIRLRRHGDGSWVQTVKAGGRGAVERYEDERPVPDQDIAAEHLAGGPLERVDVGALAPVFSTHVHRRTAVVRSGEAEIELALDEGEVHAGAAREPIRELELELKSGPVSELFAEAERRGARPGLILSLTSKAERGYALVQGPATEALSFEPPRLGERDDAGTAFQALALACLHQLTDNLERLEQRPNAEAVHQARVALRRLRVFAGAFEAVAADDQAEAVKTGLKRMAQVFADARSLDVFAAETFMPHARHEEGAGCFGQALLQAKTSAYEALAQAVAAPPFAADLLAALRWIGCGAWLNDPTTATARSQTLGEVGAAMLRHRHKVMLKRGRKLDWDDPVGRHKLRIQAKKMRYLLDVFSPDAHALLKRLKTLQAALGDLNDIHTAADTAALVLPHVDARAAFAAGSAVGERRAGVEARVRSARKAFRRFADEEPPWA